jgi:hypothetical protein
MGREHSRLALRERLTSVAEAAGVLAYEPASKRWSIASGNVKAKVEPIPT